MRTAINPCDNCTAIGCGGIVPERIEQEPTTLGADVIMPNVQFADVIDARGMFGRLTCINLECKLFERIEKTHCPVCQAPYWERCPHDPPDREVTRG